MDLIPIQGGELGSRSDAELGEHVVIIGEYPQGARDFIVGVYRYSLRV